MKELGHIQAFEKKIYLASPTMHGEELTYMKEAFDTNWMSTVGQNIDETERLIAEYVGVKHAVALSAGTAALHLAMKLAGEQLYGNSGGARHALAGKKVFASDMTFNATVNPIAYEGGEAVFIDAEADTWNMDPVALKKAFEIYPDVRLVVVAHLYGVPGKIAQLRQVCDEYGALMIEDAAESLGATYLMNGKWRETGSFGDLNCISFNGNKIITGTAGGVFLTDVQADADKIRKWSTQSREAAPWYQHEELGFNYRMSNVVAGVVRGQIPHLDEHIAQKKAIYERYRDGLRDLPVTMNPFDETKSRPNYWLSCLLIDEQYMTKSVRGERDYMYESQAGKTCPQEILDMITAINAEGRPIWKPMHEQPIYRMNAYVTREGNGRAVTNAYIAGKTEGADGAPLDIGSDIFARGLCLPSDNKMTPEEQDRLIEVIHKSFA